MTTFTVEIKDSDAEVVLAVLKKFKAKVKPLPKDNDITLEIIEAIKEVKLMREGKIPALTLADI
jgi:hypothetical protein